MPDLKEDVTADLAHVKATIASDELKAQAEVKSLWQRYEIYLVAFAALVIGIVAGHLAR